MPDAETKPKKTTKSNPAEWDALRGATLQEIFYKWDNNRKRRLRAAIKRGEFRDVFKELEDAVLDVLARNPDATTAAIARALNLPAGTVAAAESRIPGHHAITTRNKSPEPTEEEAARVAALFNGSPLPKYDEIAKTFAVPLSYARAWTIREALRRGYANADDYNQQARERLDEVNNVLRPAEYVEDVMERGALGVNLCEPYWSRYYQLYLLKKKRDGAPLVPGVDFELPPVVVKHYGGKSKKRKPQGARHGE